ncbi:Versicolorin B synthase [Daldinia childiae]|uniref:Versicolorin B synthase n=1 Tax=Daldinia childiae TaxID=326645 RepID=UPI0014484693|nr:Versicolorin B synthase [Daldinia childiae]KAF3063999.1 Versicolorin B synthase [Daldinia childiae]
MLPYFQKSCKFTPADPSIFSGVEVKPGPGNNAFSSESGPLHVSYGNNIRPFSQCLGRAFSEIGIPTIPDFNSGNLLGSQFCTFTVDPTTATRSSAQTSFLDLCQARPNLKVFRETLAKRVCINEKKQATGVEISPGLVLMARREVILSAGAFQSPQLLMVSGIGPADTLKRLGIPVIVDRPGVGQNLTDHIMYGPCHRVKVETISAVVANPAQIVPLIFDYVKNARGPLTNPGIEYVAFEKIPRHLISEDVSAKLSQLPLSWPDMEYISMDTYSGDLSSPLFNSPNDGYNYASILVSPCAPLSRGSVTITSDDTVDLPVVDPNWLSDPIDAQLAVAGYKRARELFSSAAMQDILLDSDPEKEFFPGLDTVKTDEEILHTIRNTMTTIYHASGTCRMGHAADPDPSAVVDPHARVFGVERLRVVDSSAFALLPPGHPQSMVYALAEKIADDIQREGLQLSDTPYNIDESEFDGYLYSTLSLNGSNGEYTFATCDDGNLYIQKNGTQNSLPYYSTCTTLWYGYEDVVLATLNSGILHYYNNTMSKLSVSRLRTADETELPATAAYVALAPYYYTEDESENAPSMLAAIDTINEIFPAICTYKNASAGAKVYLIGSDINAGLAIFKSPDVEYSITNGKVDDCYVLFPEITDCIDGDWADYDEDAEEYESNATQLEFDDSLVDAEGELTLNSNNTLLYQDEEALNNLDEVFTDDDEGDVEEWDEDSDYLDRFGDYYDVIDGDDEGSS